MSEINWPVTTTPEWCPAAFDEALEFDVDLTVTRNGRISTRRLPGARWRCSMTFGDTTVAYLSERRQLEAFLASLRGGADRLLLWNLLTPLPRGTMRGTPVLKDAVSAGATTATLRKCRGTINLLSSAQAFDAYPWTGTATVTANTHSRPGDGANLADTLSDSSGAAYQGRAQSITVAADATVYTVSLYVRQTSGGTSPTFGLNVNLSGGTPVAVNVRFNSQTGDISGGGATAVYAETNWWRISVPITNNSTNTTLEVSVYPATAAYGSFVDTATATGTAAAWGIQVEASATLSALEDLRPTLLRGDRITIGGQRVILTADATTSTEGECAISFQPPLRAAAASGDSATIQYPTTSYVLAQPAVVMPARGDRLPGFTVELIEA